MIPCQFEDAYSFHNGIAPVKMNNLWGYVDEQGQVIVAEIFDMARPLNRKGISPVKTDGIWTLIQFDIFG